MAGREEVVGVLAVAVGSEERKSSPIVFGVVPAAAGRVEICTVRLFNVFAAAGEIVAGGEGGLTVDGLTARCDICTFMKLIPTKVKQLAREVLISFIPFLNVKLTILVL
jgi:hypothetical protein